MKQMFKRILSLVLVIMMVVPFWPGTGTEVAHAAASNTPLEGYKKLQDLVVFKDTIPGTYTSSQFEMVGGKPPIVSDVSYEGLPSIKYNLVTQPPSYWESQVLYSSGWYPFDITRYYESGFLEFNIKGGAGGEKMVVGLQGSIDEPYLVTHPSIDIENTVVKSTVSIEKSEITGITGVTTGWQHVKIPLKQLIDLSTGFDLRSITAFVLGNDPAVPLAKMLFYINNVKITSPDNETSFPAIKVNQVGYKPDSNKVALVSGYLDELNASEGTTFELKRTSDNSTVYSGQLKLQREYDAIFSGERVLSADFSSYSVEGNYYLKVNAPGIVDSVHFDIRDSVYDDLLRDLQRYYYYQRANFELAEPFAEGYARPATHTQDNNLAYTSDLTKSRDLSGGWFDAGDLGKYTNNSAMATSQLLWSYEKFPELFPDNSNHIPESGNGKSDLLDEIKFNLDWFLKAQDYATGGFYTVISPKNYYDGRLNADNQNNQTDVKPTTVTADAVAMLAQASKVFKSYDATYAEQLLQAALRGWKYLLDNPNIPNTTGYADADDADNRFWAAASMFRATGDTLANAYVLNNYKKYTDLFLDAEYGMGRHMEFDAIMTYVSADQADSAVTSWFQENFLIWKSNIMERQKNNIWRTLLFESGAWWGSNSNITQTTMMLTLGSMLTHTFDSEVVDVIQDNYNYILGVNPVQTSYITGYGEHAMKRIFSTIYSKDLKEGTPKGYLAGGVDIYGTKAASIYQMKKFEDSDYNYRSTEHAINFQSPTIFSLAALKTFSGSQAADTTAPTKVIMNRSKAIFDRNAPTDIATFPTLTNGNALLGITNVTTNTALTSGQYLTTTTKAGTIYKSYLQTLPVGTYIFNYQFDDAQSIPVEIQVVSNGNVSAVKQQFNRNVPQDIPVTVTTNGNTLTAVKLGVTDLVYGTDYTVTGSVYTLKQNYLAQLLDGVSTFTFDFATGEDRNLSVAVVAVSPDGAVAPANSTFVKYAPSDLSFTVTHNGKTLNGIKYGLTQLQSGVDYTVTGNVYTIKSSFLQTMRVGYQGLQFDFNTGVDGMVNILVKDNATAIVTDKTYYTPVSMPTYHILKDASVDVLVMFNGNALSAIKNGATTIAASNYTVKGHFYYIKNSYLKTLPEGANTLTFDFATGADVNVTINVVKADAAPKLTTFNKNQPRDLTFTMKTASGSLKNLKNGNTALVKNTDYVVSGTTYTIKSSYLSSLAKGTYTLTFDLGTAAITNPSVTIQVDAYARLNEKLTGAADIRAGEQITVSYGVYQLIQSTEAGSVYAQDTTINYDPEVLEFVNLTPLKGGYSLVGHTNDASIGKLRFLASKTAPDGGITTDGDLFQMNWKVKASPLQPSVTMTTYSQFLDDQGRDVDVTGDSLSMNIMVVNRAALLDAISSAQSLYASSVEGIHHGEYPTGSKTVLLTAIDQAIAVNDNGTATQAQLDLATANLLSAIQSFTAMIIARLKEDVFDNGDGLINIKDLWFVAVHYLQVPAGDYIRADVNGDGVINILDLSAVAKKILGL